MSKGEEARNLFCNGCNCAQAVFTAFCNETGMDKETALKLSSSFGGGMGRLREVCGAVSGMFMVAGILKGYSDVCDTAKKAEHYRLIQEMAKEFQNEFGSIVCRELLNLRCKHDNPQPSERTKEYYISRSCADFVAYAAEIAEKKLLSETVE